MRKRRRIPLQRGDLWELTTNNGRIQRHINSVACGVVSYLNNGHFYQCSFSTFRRWAWAAELLSSDNWKAHEAKMVPAILEAK